jgi:hypothetical protein
MKMGAALAMAGIGMGAQAAVVEYQLVAGSSEYNRMRTDPSTFMPIANTTVNVSGTVRVDTATGALVSAALQLGSYTESFDYAPLSPLTNFALVDHTNETQQLGAGAAGGVAGTVISFSGASAGAASGVGGSAGCSASAGSQGDATCAAAALAPWGPFEISLLFTPDFSAFMASSYWEEGGGLDTAHTLDLFAVRVNEVPIPAAAWLLGSGLTGLLALARRRSR